MAYPPSTTDLDNRLTGYPWASSLSSTQKTNAINRGRYLIEIRYPNMDTETDADLTNFGWWLCVEIAAWYAGLPYVNDSVTGVLARTWLEQWDKILAPALEEVAMLNAQGKPLRPKKK